MATTITQISGSITSLITTGMNALANNASAISSAYTMSPAGYLMAELELVVTYGTNPTASTGCSIWFLRAIDGTNYEDGGAGTPGVLPARAPDVVIPVAVSTSAQRITKRCLVPPGTFTVLLKNDGTGQAMAASGNTLKILPLTYQNG